MHVLFDNWAVIGRGFLQTLELAGISAVTCLIVGQLLAVMRVSPIPPLRGAATGSGWPELATAPEALGS